MTKATTRWWWASALALGLAAVGVAPGPLPALTLDSSFEGQASSTVVNGPGFYTVGEDYTVYLQLASIPFQNAPWYPWESDREYTAVVTAPVTFFMPPFSQNGLRIVRFGTGTVQIYEDAVSNADPSDPGTYTDGLLLLWGTITGMSGSGSGAPSELVMSFNTAAGDPSDGIEFFGGPGLPNIECDTGARIEIDDAATFDPSPPSGYDENYAANWQCSATTVSVEEDTWGRVKALYR